MQIRSAEPWASSPPEATPHLVSYIIGVWQPSFFFSLRGPGGASSRRPRRSCPVEQARQRLQRSVPAQPLRLGVGLIAYPPPLLGLA
jgi:hypothetical protein